MLCLPQAFELFLKHLVGGLHTVYTKLKRLDIVPLVCNVEQVRILRGLGAIQPGVNRCKLLSCKDFDVLYRDCTTARKHNFLGGSKATNCSTMGISWRQFITNDQQVAGEPRAADGKQRMNANASELKRTPIKDPPTVSGVHARNARQHSNPHVQFEKRTHTNDTRESLLARQNYLGLSISVSRTIEISSHSLFAASYMFVSIAFDSFMTVDLNEFGMCVFFPLVSNSTSFREAVG
ncbi:unnamed protein product [Arctia plantaginis]|uniref:SKI/SNO/DAC domain-containing protein n=1 Tax=Arctia plantaginis TaxID=874455 RepID=A0A8S1ASH0_ARCPL|nr:unnamed protein product [Arctia plantaginis]